MLDNEQIVADLKKDVERLRERLQFDPGGSDKIDELEQALQFTRHELDVLKAEVKRLNSLLAANRLLTRSAIHNMVQPEQVGGYIYGCPLPDEIRLVKAEPTAAQEREAIVKRLQSMIRECYANGDVASDPLWTEHVIALRRAIDTIERGEHWPKDKGTL